MEHNPLRTSSCRLCRNTGDLQVSHILPRFLGKYLKETSATGFLTAVDENGRPSRAQDLYKTKLLCSGCEGILNQSETFFANAIFHPYKQSTLKSIPIDDRIARFVVSVSLRALWMMQLIKHPLAIKWEHQLASLEDEWRSFLLRAPGFRIGSHSHHILLTNEAILAAGLGNSPNLIFNVLRTSAYYLFEKFGKAYLFANMAGVQVISMISPPDLPLARGTQVYPTQTFGVIKPPGIGWGGYFQNLLHLAQTLDAACSNLSDRQREKIDYAMSKDPARLARSEDARVLMMQRVLLGSLRSDKENKPEGSNE